MLNTKLQTKKTILLFAALTVGYLILFAGFSLTPLYDIANAHNDRLFSADDVYYAKYFYSTAMDTSPRIIKHPLLIAFACLFTRVETALLGPISWQHHYMLIVLFQMVCSLLSCVYLFRILNEQYKLSRNHCLLFCGIYALAFSTLFYTFIAESYILSSLILILTFYYAPKKKPVITVLLGVLAAGVTITNAALWAVIVLCSGGTLKYRIKVLAAGGILFCLIVAVLPIRETFFSYLLPGSMNSARNYSDHFGLWDVVKRVFFIFFGSTVFFLDTANQSAFGEFVGGALSFLPSASLPVVLLALLWVVLLMLAAVLCRKDRRLLPPLAVLLVNLLLHGVIQYGLKEGFLYSLHHFPAQLLIAALLFVPERRKSRLTSGGAVFLIVYLVASVLLNLYGGLTAIHQLLAG